MVEGMQLNVVDGPVLCGASKFVSAADHKTAPNRLLCVDAGDEGVGFSGDDVVDIGL